MFLKEEFAFWSCFSNTLELGSAFNVRHVSQPYKITDMFESLHMLDGRQEDKTF
jgi:hypothetical protein